MTNWETCVQFHGHACGGLTIGYKAACYAAELLELSFSGDEQVVCIAENDACGVDAIQALLGCSIGKGNLLFHMRGKQAFSFYNRATGKSVRLVLRPRPEGMTREESFAYYQARRNRLTCSTSSRRPSRCQSRPNYLTPTRARAAAR